MNDNVQACGLTGQAGSAYGNLNIPPTTFHEGVVLFCFLKPIWKDAKHDGTVIPERSFLLSDLEYLHTLAVELGDSIELHKDSLLFLSLAES